MARRTAGKTIWQKRAWPAAEMPLRSAAGTLTALCLLSFVLGSVHAFSVLAEPT